MNFLEKVLRTIGSETDNSPSPPCAGLSPRSWFSLRLKNGRTSLQLHPALPRCAQPSTSRALPRSTACSMFAVMRAVLKLGLRLGGISPIVGAGLEDP